MILSLTLNRKFSVLYFVTNMASTTSFAKRFIAGQCRIWCRRTNGDNPMGWQPMTYPSRGWHDCVAIVADYERRFPGAYDYEITADLDCCRPRW